SNIFSIYQAFASADETAAMRKAFADGIGWGDAKQKLFARIGPIFASMRAKYDALIGKPGDIEEILHAGAARARALATPFLGTLRFAAGLRDLRAKADGAASAASTKTEKPALQPVVFRDGNGFAFKVLDASRAVLAEQGGFADPKTA